MDWTNVELVSIPEMDEKANSEPILAGLSATPSNLHDAFLTDLPHLQEIQNAHASHLATAGEEVEAHFSVLSNLQTADTAIATLGGFREGDSLVLPLQGAIQDRVQLEMAMHGDLTALKHKLRELTEPNYRAPSHYLPGANWPKPGGEATV